MKLESLEVDDLIFMDDSLCSYYKRLWSKCKRLWTSKYIHNFWVSNGSVSIKIGENSKPNTINITDLSLHLLCSSDVFIPDSCVIAFIYS